MTDEHKLKIGKANKTFYEVNPEARVRAAIKTSIVNKTIGKLPPSRRGIKSSLESRIKRSVSMKKAHREGRHRLYKGGITPTNRAIRMTLEYRLWRESVFQRDNFTCIWCGARSSKGMKVILQADHIKPFSLFPELHFAIDNGRTLCEPCHRKTDTYCGRANRMVGITPQ